VFETLRERVGRWIRGRAVESGGPASDASEQILDALKKQARANAKQSARLESMLAEIDRRTKELAARRSEPASSYDDLFDALDALDAAMTFAPPDLREGLARVAARLERFAERQGFSRVAARGVAPDPRLFRVVGVDPRGDSPAGTVNAIVRAAIVRGDQVVREGEVLVSRARGAAPEERG
jgi:molecular chaperone GrpE (heat shock protein)